MSEKPNPGSDEALLQGCKCPVIDNSHGRGAFGGAANDDDGKPLFWVSGNCPLHKDQMPEEPCSSEDE